MFLRNQVNQSAVDDEDIVASIVVEILRARAPAHVLRGQLRDTRALGHVFELLRAGILHEAVEPGIGHPQVGPSVAVEIREHRPHGGSALAILSVRHAGRERDLFEGPVLLVVEQEILGLVVGHVNIGVAVQVEIGRRHAHGAALEFGDAGRFAKRR